MRGKRPAKEVEKILVKIETETGFLRYSAMSVTVWHVKSLSMSILNNWLLVSNCFIFIFIFICLNYHNKIYSSKI